MLAVKFSVAISVENIAFIGLLLAIPLVLIAFFILLVLFLPLVHPHSIPLEHSISIFNSNADGLHPGLLAILVVLRVLLQQSDCLLHLGLFVVLGWEGQYLK